MRKSVHTVGKDILLRALLAGTVIAILGGPRTTCWSAATVSQVALGSHRVMQTFDFEERDIHFETLPMYWKKVVGRTGFPHYSTGRLDTEHARSGEYSFLLIPDGGSVGFEYHRRKILVKSGSDFQVSGYVHFDDAHTCRAQITCVLTDRLGRPIPGSESNSPFAAPGDQAADGWARLDVYVPGNFPQARYIAVAVWVLQEELWRQGPLVRERIYRRDVAARVSFDDITLYQFPRVILRTDRPTNAFEADEPAILAVEVDGVSVSDYEVSMSVQGTDGLPVHDESWVLSGVVGETTVRTVELSGLAAGQYHASLQIMSGHTTVAHRELTFVKLGPLRSSVVSSGRGFGILALDDNAGEWQTVLELTRRSNASLLKLPVWRSRPDQTGAIFGKGSFHEKLVKLQESNIEVIATFSEVPESLALQLQVGRRSLLDVLTREESFWQPLVRAVLAQYARTVPSWQVGADVAGDTQVWDPRIRPVVDTMRREYEELVSDTVLAVPISGMFAVSEQQTGTRYVALGIPAAISPADIPDYLDDCRTRGMDRLWTTIEPLDIDRYGRKHRLIDFAKRIAFAKKGDAEAVFINHPWVQRQYHARTVTDPAELLPVFRTLADQLGGSQYVGTFDMADGIPALIFSQDTAGCLFVWNDAAGESGSDDEGEMTQLFLGDDPTAVDLFGNPYPITTVDGTSRLRVGQWPVLLSGVDVRMAMIRASMELSPRIVDASISRQQLELRFVNPFNTPITGRLRFVLPGPARGNWQVDPANLSFALQPRQEFRQTIAMQLPRNELGGKKNLTVALRVDADHTYRVQVAVPFEIRLHGVDVSVFARRLNDRDLLIQVAVNNESDEETSLICFAVLPDLDRLEKPIAGLQPGQIATKQFLVRDAARWMGRFIRVGLFDPKGTKRINYQIEIN